MAINAGKKNDTFSVDLSLFAGKVSDMAAGNIPAGVSPYCTDVFFGAQWVATRPALLHAQPQALEETGNILSHGDYRQQTGQTNRIELYDDGALWQYVVETTADTQVGTVSPGVRFNATAAFDKFFMAMRGLSLTSPFTDAQLAGGDTPTYINALGNLARVVTDGPGGGLSVTGVNIGPEDLVTPGVFQVGPAITGITYGGAKTVTIVVPNRGTITETIYTNIEVTLASGQSLTAGQVVQLYNIQWTNPGGPQWPNGVPVASVISSTQFTVAISSVNYTNTASAGTFAYGNASTVSLNRVSNIVTAYLAGTSPSSPTAIQAGWFTTIVDTQASSQAQLPNGSVPFTANELFQAIYPNNSTGDVPTLIAGAVANFYPHNHPYQGQFEYSFPTDPQDNQGDQPVLPPPAVSMTLDINQGLTFNVYPDSLLPGLSTGNTGNNTHPMAIFGVTQDGQYSGTQYPVPYRGTGGSEDENLCMIVSGQLNIPAAGTYQFQINHQEGILVGFGNGAINPGGNPYVDPQNRSLTALNGYKIMAANNVSQNYAGFENPITFSVQFASAGIFPFEIDWCKGDNDDTSGAFLSLTMSNVVSGSPVPIVPGLGPGAATIQGDGVGNVHVTLPTAVANLPIGAWLYLYINTPQPSYIQDWVISSNGTGLITVPNTNPNAANQVWQVGTEILLGGFSSTSNPQPTGWNGQTVTITAVDDTNPAAPVYQFLWNGPTGSGTSTTGTATPVNAAYPSGWIQVTGVISTTEFTYQAVGNVSTQMDSGIVYDYFGSLNTDQALTANNQQVSPGIVTESSAASDNGVVQGFQVLSVNTSTTPNSITWYQPGFDDTYTGTHLLQVQPQSSIPGGPRGAFCFFINEDGGASPGSYPINLQLSGGTQFAQITIPLGPPGTTARGVAFTPAYGSDYFALGAAQIPATAGQAPIITLGTIIEDNTTTSIIIDFTDVALEDGIPVSGANAIGSDYGDLTSTIVLPPCLGVIEYETYLVWYGELNCYPNHAMINMGMSGGCTSYSGSAPVGQPLGWDTKTEVNSITPSADGELVLSPDDLGFAYQMTGSTGNVNFVIYSPSKGVLASASVAISKFGASWAWYYATFNTAMPASIPQDALFYVSASTGNNNLISQGAWQNAWGSPILLPNRSYIIRFKAVVSDENPQIWDLQLIDAAQPVLNNQLRLSYAENEFGYDNENGFTIALDTSDFIASLFKQRQFLYINTENELHVTQNNGQVPAEWDNSFVADECGSCGPDAVCTGKSTAFWVGRHGLQVFEGREPRKINQYVIQDFDQMNWNAAVNTCMGYDPVNRVLYCSFPTGAAVNPNFLETMSFRLADSAVNVADPVHVSQISGKIIATDLGWKFSPVALSINSMAMCAVNTPSGIAKTMTFGGGSAGPVEADATSDAAGASGNINISIDPPNADDVVLVATSPFDNSASTPAGWTKVGENLYFMQAQNLDTLNFNQANDGVLPAWSAVMASFQTAGYPATEQGQLIDFGTQPEDSYNTAFNNPVNAGDTIIVNFLGTSDDVPSFSVSDSDNNIYVLYQNSVEIGGLIQTAFMAVALGCRAGTPTVSLQISNFGPNGDNTTFDINMFTLANFSGPQGFGQLYYQDFVNYPPTNPRATQWNCTDADYGQIFSEYQTYFFFAHDVEQQATLSLYRKLFCYMAFHAVGVGDLLITPYVDALGEANAWTPLPAFPLQLQDPGYDYDIGLNVTGNRCSFLYTSEAAQQTGQVGPSSQSKEIGVGGEDTSFSITTTPANVGDWVLMVSSTPYATYEGTPPGWALFAEDGGALYTTATSLAPITFTGYAGGVGAPDNEWAAVMASFAVNATPTIVQQESYGSGAGAGAHTVTFNDAVSEGDIIVVVLHINAPTSSGYAGVQVTDNMGNPYTIIQTGQNISGGYMVGAFLAVAPYVATGTQSVTITIPNNGTQASGSAFDMSGIVPAGPPSTAGAFWLTHMIVSAREDRVFPVRGAL